ncbi:VWA domain-containing protein [Oxalobacteraceae bacterium CAVE-383]|nr:VWA domain-containing protein [Oxalobacteraceae bacterium CAVE-383]
MRGYTVPGVRAAFKRRAAGIEGEDADHDHPGQTLEGVAPVLGLYFRALSGRNAALLPFGDRNDPEQYPDTHTTIRLPDRIVRFFSGNDNFIWYKIALTHRAAHYEGGTFAFRLKQPAAYFSSLRPSDLGAREIHELESDLEIFFSLFAQRQLAIEVFTVMEDLRLDEWSKRRYAGLKNGYEKIQRASLHDRPALAGMGPRNALAEIMVSLSLGAKLSFSAPRLLHEPARRMALLMQPLGNPDARVEDSAEAAMRAYCLLVGLPNMEADYGPADPIDFTAPVGERRWPTIWPEPEKTRLEGDDVLATEMAPVSYRDQLGSRFTNYQGAGPLDQQAIYRFTKADAPASDSAPNVDGEERPKPPDEPMEHDHHDHFGEDAAHLHSGELHSHELLSYVYPEWDHVAAAYKRNWCCVKESRIDPAVSAKYFEQTLRGYGRLMPRIRNQFERIAREGLLKIKRAADGDDLDLDAAIESMIDVRAGLSPSDQVYTSRQRLARDVAVAFLVDKSSSTAEHVDPPDETNGLAPQVHLHGRNYRTILDLEKETAALLMASLEKLGDTYGIYFFSGSGREDVKFHVLKDFEERLSDRVAARIDNIKPLHTTRMGPAIRHAIRKLRGQESRTKLLMLISDGRPFDLDYGQQYGENAEVDYAIHDTRQALNEARLAGITPFVLTIDPQGNDYLRTMCDGIDYEVLDDINQLPARLLSLYRTLTA